MVQASNKQSRKADEKARGDIKTNKGWFWCHEKQGFFRHSDWHLTRKEMGEKYEN